MIPNDQQHEEQDVELEELSGEEDRGSGEKDPKGSAPPLPGGEVQAPRERIELTSQTTRLFLQEIVRAGLALSFVVLLALVIILAFHDIKSKAWPNVREALEILVPTLSGLIGAATGFYFGTRR
jgi:hypothetical protein